MSTPAHRAGFVAIVGRPNSGKSTLLNALVGEKLAITAHQPQTTRTTLQGVVTTPNAQIVFIDTPGIHNARTIFNDRMMQALRSALKQPDLILYLVDASRPEPAGDEDALHLLPKTAMAFLVPNKVDRIKDKRLLLPLIERYLKLFPFIDAVPISAKEREGISELKNTIEQHLPEGPALFSDDYLTDQPARFLAAEIIRERILHALRDEVPHAVAVQIDAWEEKPRITRIAATIHVERSGQKAILIGSHGQMLKRIGTESRERLEKLLGKKVFLSLFVKVKPHWREDAAFLDAIDWRSMVGSEST